jgi:hypothetical protein
MGAMKTLATKAKKSRKPVPVMSEAPAQAFYPDEMPHDDTPLVYGEPIHPGSMGAYIEELRQDQRAQDQANPVEAGDELPSAPTGGKERRARVRGGTPRRCEAGDHDWLDIASGGDPVKNCPRHYRGPAPKKVRPPTVPDRSAAQVAAGEVAGRSAITAAKPTVIVDAAEGGVLVPASTPPALQPYVYRDTGKGTFRGAVDIGKGKQRYTKCVGTTVPTYEAAKAAAEAAIREILAGTRPLPTRGRDRP